MKKNIGIVTTWFERGAAYVSRQYRDLLKDDYNVFIYARGGEEYAIGDSNWDGNDVTWGKKSLLPVPMPINKKDFKQWINNNNIEIILFNEQQWWMPIIWAKELGVICGSYVDYYTEETIPLFNIFDFLICNTKRHLDAFNWHPYAYYIPWGTDVEVFSTKSYDVVDENCTTFFHSSGMSPKRKGTDQLIEAFHNLKGRKKLVIHSQVDLVERLPKQKEIINDLLVKKELEIINQTVSAPGLYHLGDIYVYPSRLEGIGLTIAEAISCGLPTIVPDNAPMNEFIQEDSGKTVLIEKYFSREDGYYWPQCEVNIDNLTEQMQFYIDNFSKLKSYKENTRKFAIENLNWKSNKKGLVDIFKYLKYQKFSNYNFILDYENKKASSHWVRKLYVKCPFIYRLLITLYSYSGRKN